MQPMCALLSAYLLTLRIMRLLRYLTYECTERGAEGDWCGSAVSLGVVWYTSGLGYVMSVMLEQQNSMVASVAVCLVLGGFFNGIEPRFRTLSSFMKAVFGAPPPLLLCNLTYHCQWVYAGTAVSWDREALESLHTRQRTGMLS